MLRGCVRPTNVTGTVVHCLITCVPLWYHVTKNFVTNKILRTTKRLCVLSPYGLSLAASLNYFFLSSRYFVA
jgi:hypothetical protein